MDFIQTIHGLWRWVFGILAVVVVVKYALGWLTSAKFTALDQKLAGWFAWAMTIQWVLGLLNLVIKIMGGAFNSRVHIEHLTIGTIALALSHMTNMFRKRGDRARFLGSLILILLALALGVMNVARVRGGWFYSLP